MPKEYRAAQEEMKRQMKEQWQDRPLLSGPLSLKIMVKGEGRGDLDNIAGALMDSGHNILWDEDRVSVISELSISWTKAPKKDSEWIVHIKNLWTP
jgi:Holliday junction resolvase RusA-like endonuclease